MILYNLIGLVDDARSDFGLTKVGYTKLKTEK